MLFKTCPIIIVFTSIAIWKWLVIYYYRAQHRKDYYCYRKNRKLDTWIDNTIIISHFEWTNIYFVYCTSNGMSLNIKDSLDKEIIRGIRISLLAEIPSLFHDWLRRLNEEKCLLSKLLRRERGLIDIYCFLLNASLFVTLL